MVVSDECAGNVSEPVSDIVSDLARYANNGHIVRFRPVFFLIVVFSHCCLRQSSRRTWRGGQADSG